MFHRIRKMIKLIFILFFLEGILYSQGPYHENDTKTKIPDTELEIQKESELDWKDYEIPDLFPELKILDQLDPKTSEQYLKSAKNNYELALKVIKQGKEEVNTIPSQMESLPEKHYWQILEKQEKIQKKQKEIMTRSYKEAKNYIIKGLKDLENIKSSKILQTDYYINLKSNLLRHYVLIQLSLNDISGIIPSIEEYFSLRKSHQEEPQPYKILAFCYQNLEKSSKRSKVNEEIIMQYKKLKYKNLVQYVILKYGKSSPQYEYLKKEIEREFIQDIL